MMRRIDLRGATPAFDYRAAVPRADFDVEAAEHVVRPICEAVRTRGLEAVLELNERFDGVVHDDIAVSPRALQDALSIDPANLQAYLDLTRMYVEAGRLDDVRTQLEAIAARQPKAIWAPTMIAISLELQNRPAEARDRYRKVLEIDSRAAIANNNLAMIYMTEGQDLNMALQLAQTAVQVLPNSPEVHDTLGSVYLKQNLPALAVGPFALSATQDPANPLR